MPDIKPISDLRNYTDVLREVRENNPVYLTRNGRGELDRLRASLALMAQLEDGEKSARESGWISADDVEATLGL